MESSRKRTIELRRGIAEQKTEVCYTLRPLGRDWLLLITGGQAHVGSVACSQSGRDEPWQFTLGTHKEGPIVRNAVAALRGVLEGEVLVVGGIHYDRIAREQIGDIERHCEELLHELVARIRNRRP